MTPVLVTQDSKSVIEVTESDAWANNISGTTIRYDLISLPDEYSPCPLNDDGLYGRYDSKGKALNYSDLPRSFLSPFNFEMDLIGRCFGWAIKLAGQLWMICCNSSRTSGENS